MALLLLTLSLALGVAGVSRFSSPRWPRFVLDSLHRNVSLLALAFLLVHILTAVLDSFAPISLIDAFVPFAGSYRPFWLGLGAIAFDLLLAVTLTSLVRRRLGYGAWRATHWLAYACWPIALLHGLGTGSDVKSTWLLGLSIACLVIVALAVGVRAISRLAGARAPARRRARRDRRVRAVPRDLAARRAARARLGAALGHADFTARTRHHPHHLREGQSMSSPIGLPPACHGCSPGCRSTARSAWPSTGRCTASCPTARAASGAAPAR